MKKVIALTLAGAMVFSTPVMAKEVGAPVAEYLEESSYIGIPAETVHAIDQNKVIGEHMNNAVVDVWAMDGKEVQSVAIGQGAVIDGEESPALTFELVKPDLKRVYAAKELAKDKGTLMTVVSVHTHVAFETAKVTFYAPGVKAGQAITVYQRVDDENWTACPTEVSDDKVVVDITANEHLAFIEGQAVAVAEPKAVVETKVAAEPKVEAEASAAVEVEEKAAVTAETKAEEKAEASVETKKEDEAKADAEEKTEAAAEAEADSDVKLTVKTEAEGETVTVTEVK